jgi:pyridoxal phosphate enzyme (YggS family)
VKKTLPTISQRLAEVRHRIEAAALACGRDPDTVTLVAVGKTQPAEVVREAFDAGATVFGENRVQEAVAKRAEIPEATWHFIGPLQRNKARAALETFHMIETVDRLSIAHRLQRLLEEHDPGRRQKVLIEVNVGREEQKAGVEPEQAEELVRATAGCANLLVEGLMAIPPWTADPEASRGYFRELRLLRNELQERLGLPLPHLSMGMSHDYEVAISEGATFVRVGTAIFGPRRKR